MKIVKKLGVAALVIFVGMQFYRPRPNRAEAGHAAIFEAETAPGPAVVGILKTNCYDCHSDHTEYPWYNTIAPVSYWLDQHIDHGKEHLNFSQWADYDLDRKDHKLEEIVEEVKKGKMPLKEYTWTHGTLTSEERDAVVEWAESARARYRAGGAPD